MAYSVNLFTLEDGLNSLLERMRTNAETLAHSPSFTNEGKLEKWDQLRGEYFNSLQTLRGQLNAVRRGTNNLLNYARSAAVGTPPDVATPNIPAELQLARILNRPTKWDMDTINAELNKLLGTPTAALFIEEMIARDHVEAHVIDALIEHNVPEVGEARDFQQLAQTAISNIFNPLMNDLDELYDHGPLTPSDGATGGVEQQYRITLADILGSGPATIADDGSYTYNANNKEKYGA